MVKKYKEVNIYKWAIKTDYGEMTADSMSNNLETVKKELRENFGYGDDRIKSIKLLKRKVKGMVRV